MRSFPSLTVCASEIGGPILQLLIGGMGVGTTPISRGGMGTQFKPISRWMRAVSVILHLNGLFQDRKSKATQLAVAKSGFRPFVNFDEVVPIGKKAKKASVGNHGDIRFRS